MPTFVELQRDCNTQDIYDLLEMLDAKAEMDEVYRQQAKNDN